MGFKKEIVSLLGNKHLRNQFGEQAEFLIDTLVDSEVFNGFPIIGTLTNAGKFALSYSDRRFGQKIGRFLNALDGVSQPEIDEFLNELGDEDAQAKAGEKILGLLDSFEDAEKAIILGRVFVCYIKGEISKDDFDLYGFAINRAFIWDLKMLRYAVKNENIFNDGLGNALMACRLVELHVVAVYDDAGRNEYSANRYGKKLAEILDEIYKD